MKFFSGLLLFAAVSVCPSLAVAGGTKASDVAYPVKYEGGSLHLEHGKVTARLENRNVVISTGRQSIVVPAESITGIAYGDAVRRRFGAAVLDVVPFMRLGEAETYYVGVSWTDTNRNGTSAAKSEAVFRLTAAERREFLTALERLTGKKATDTDQVPTVVRYGL
jgi:hypothetical protein